MSGGLQFDEENSRKVESLYLTPDVVAQRRQVLKALALREGKRNEVERCTADPGPPRTGKVPGLQRIVALRFTLRCARDTRSGAVRGDVFRLQNEFFT